MELKLKMTTTSQNLTKCSMRMGMPIIWPRFSIQSLKICPEIVLDLSLSLSYDIDWRCAKIVRSRDLHDCGNGYNPAGFRRIPAGVETVIKKKPAVTTITGMIFAVIPRDGTEFWGIPRIYLTIFKIFLHSLQHQLRQFLIDNGPFRLLCSVVDLTSVAYVSERVFTKSELHTIHIL